MRRRVATLIVAAAITTQSCATTSRVAAEPVSVVAATAPNAPALKMGCVERGLVGSRDLVPEGQGHCSCETPSVISRTRAQAVADIRIAAAKLGANVVWIRSEWQEQWEAVHCSDCAVTQYRVVGIAYTCGLSGRMSRVRSISCRVFGCQFLAASAPVVHLTRQSGPSRSSCSSNPPPDFAVARDARRGSPPPELYFSASARAREPRAVRCL